MSESKKDKGAVAEEVFGEIVEKETYALGGGDVLDIVGGLIQLILAFMPAEQAKREIDKAWAQRVNDAADVAEDIRFGGDPSKN